MKFVFHIGIDDIINLIIGGGLILAMLVCIVMLGIEYIKHQINLKRKMKQRDKERQEMKKENANDGDN